MIAQEKIKIEIREIIERCAEDLTVSVLQTIKGGTFSDAVAMVQDMVNKLGVNVLQMICREVDNVFDERRNRHKVIIKHRAKSRRLLTSLGEVALDRRLYYDKIERRFFFAVDEMLKLEKNSRIEAGMKAQLIRSATLTSYGRASEFAKHKISRQTIHNLVKNLNKDSTKLSVKEKREVENIYIEADEDHIHLQNGRPSEVRLVYVHEGAREVCKGRRELINPRYFASTVGDPDDIWNEVAHYVYSQYKTNHAQIHISGDGAYWIKYGLQVIPRAQYHLDKFHVHKSLTEACGADKHLRRLFIQAIKERDETALKTLYFGRRKLLTNCSERNSLTNAYFYISNNLDEIDLSPRHKCRAEGHISHVLSSRMSSRPMAWSIAGAERIAQLRAYYYNQGDFSKLVLNKEKTQEKNINQARCNRNDVIDNQTPTDYYKTAHIVGLDGITDDLARKFREILKN